MNDDFLQAPKMASVTNVLTLLLEKAQENLTPQEVKWLSSGIDELVYLELDNLQTVVSGIAGLVGADEIAGNFRSKESVAGLMYSIAHQLDVISGLSQIKPRMALYELKTGLKKA
jgi:hypothetical protein